MSHHRCQPAVLTAASLICLLALWTVRPTAAERPERPPGGREGSEAPDRAAERIREGTRFNGELGYFKSTGDRITFYQNAGDRRYQVLENLALDRIASLVGETPEPLEWIVTGTITEFRGANFLLVTRATLKPRGGPQDER